MIREVYLNTRIRILFLDNYISIKEYHWLLLDYGWILMLVLPGQGLLTILVGLMLSDYPGKFKLRKRIIKTNLVLKTINWYRTKSNIPPLIFK